MLSNRLSELRKVHKLRQEDLAKRVGIARTTYAMYEQGKREPDYEILQKLADFFEVSVDYLLGRTAKQKPHENDGLPELTDKDERDIQKDLQLIINNLASGEGYSQYDGQTIEDMDEEDRELLISSLENSMRIAKRIAKQKFTPKKFKK